MSGKSPISAKAAFGVFCISFCVFTAAAITPALATLYGQFADQPAWVVTLIQSSTSITILVGILLFGAIERKVKYKTLASVGLLIAAIFGILPAFSFANHSVFVIILCRLAHGLGDGLYFSLGAAWFARMVRDEHKRTTYLNWNQAIGSFGSAVMTFVAGWLCAAQWNYTFYVYILLIIGWLLMLFTFQEPKSVEEIIAEEGAGAAKDFESAKKVSLPPFVWGCIICLLLNQIGLSQNMMTMGTLMAINNAGGVGLVGTLFSIFPLATTVFCLFGGAFQRALRQFATPVIVILSIVASLCVYFGGSSVAMYTIGMILLGFGTGIVGFVMFDMSLNTSPAGVAWAASLIMFGNNLGNVLSSFAFGAFSAINPANPGMPVLCGAGVYALVFVIYLILNCTCKGWKDYNARAKADKAA